MVTNFGKFYVAFNSPIYMNGDLKQVKNTKHEYFGKWRIATDMHYNPLLDHPKYAEYMDYETAYQILKDLGFVELKEGFDRYDLNDLKEIKSQLSAEWVELTNGGFEVEGMKIRL